MDHEIELKLKLSSVDDMRARLVEHKAEPHGAVLETNRIFDDDERTLRNSGCGLRLRTARPLKGDSPPTHTLTYKGPRKPGVLKIRPECETHIDCAETLAAIFGQLGYAERIRYEKHRETWTLDDVEIVLDEIPQLGWYCEIEGPDEASVLAMRERLKLEAEPAVPQSYIELARRHGNRTADGPTVLAFGG